MDTFQQQLQVELDRSHFEKVADNHIYLVQNQNQLPLVNLKEMISEKQMIRAGAISL